MRTRNLAAILALVLLSSLVGACGWTTVTPGNVGIVINATGTDRGVESYPTTTGRVFYNPINTEVKEWPVSVQTVSWTHSVTEGKPVNEEITFTNKDKMSIAVDVTLAYQLEAAKVPAFYVKFRTDDMGAWSDGFLRNLAREKFDAAGGRYSIDEIMGDNKAFLDEVEASLQKDLDPFGVHLVQFGLNGAPRPPQSVIDAINASQHAKQVAVQIQNELAQTQAEAQKATAKAQAQQAIAEAEARAAVAKAEGEAEANRKLAASITPQLIELRRIERWHGDVPQVTGGATPIIDLRAAGGK